MGSACGWGGGEGEELGQREAGGDCVCEWARRVGKGGARDGGVYRTLKNEGWGVGNASLTIYVTLYIFIFFSTSLNNHAPPCGGW